MNATGAQVLIRDPFNIAFAKNFVLMVVWLSLSSINISVVATFFSHQVFFEDPRYILFVHMVINDAVQLTVTVGLFIVSYVLYSINVSVCCTFLLMATFTTRCTPINLAAMAIERFIAICKPLRYAQICTVRRTYILIGLIWFICIVTDLFDLFLTLAIEPISFFYSSVMCIRQNVFKDSVLQYKKQVLDAIYFSLVTITLVYTYVRVLFAAQAACGEKTSAQKARNTILLHGAQLLMCLLSYVSPNVEVVLNVILPGHVLEIRYANYLIVYILPRFLSPIIYGVRDRKFCTHLKKYLRFALCNCTKWVSNQE